MKRIRTVLLACIICGLSVGGFLAGRASAQQVLPREEVTQYQFPMSWGTLKTVVSVENDNVIYYFEAIDGVIRAVSIEKGGTLLTRVQVMHRSGSAPRGGPGTLR